MLYLIGFYLTLPKTLANQYKDMYVEMDVELLAPDIEHSIGVNDLAYYDFEHIHLLL
jgi:uncharacterized membrane protein YfhO